MDLRKYQQFVLDQRSDLQRIVRACGGASSVGDVENEVWITAVELTAKFGREICFSCKSDRNLILAWTYQRLVRYCEQTLRHAASFDSSGLTGDKPALSDVLTCGAEEDPVWILQELGAYQEPTKPDDFSASAAWLALLERFDNQMTEVAYFLKISLSHTYRCYNRILLSSRTQHHLPLGVCGSRKLALTPWRRFRCYRRPRQLCFEFDEPLDLQ